MKEIPLTQGFYATVDDEDYPVLAHFKWYALYSPHSNTFYAIRNIGKKPNRKSIRMHDFIMGALARERVDHLDHNGLNNSKTNLRKCTNAENMANQKLRSNNKSGYKGVYLAFGKWKAQIRVSGRNISLGCYSNPKEAAFAYDHAAARYFGEFALTNSTLGLLENK